MSANCRHLEEIETEVGKSLEILTRDLEKLKDVSRSEEYQQTLEVLDNVLAEFDEWPQETEDMNFSNGNLSLDFDEDDHLNQNTSDFQKGSLPVIPMRSPTTRLSKGNDNSKLLSHKIVSPPRTHDKQPHFTAVPRDPYATMTTEIADEHLHQLRSKFQRVRELLEKNVIKLLDVDPPSFIPPTPCGELSPIRQSPTVEDIPYLLPTDVLLRPQFGMTYSLEEDLPPGVKEIHRTSTPKSDANASSFSREFGRLSAFSSELSSDHDRVPITSFKSLTLPHGLDRFPFYSQEENSFWRRASQKSADCVLPREEETKTKKPHFSFRKLSRKSKTGSVL